MLHLIQQTANQTMVMTLSEGLTGSNLVNPYYLFTVRSQTIPETVITACILDITTDYGVYQEATIDTNVEAPLSGNIELSDAGLYVYYVYAQTSSTNLDPDSADLLVEQGTLRIT